MVAIDRRAELDIIAERPRRIPQDVIDRIIELDPSDSNYPLKRPFEIYYQAYTPGPNAPLIGKYYVALSLVEDGRYKGPSLGNDKHSGLQFLVDKFIPEGKEGDPEAIELRDNLHLMVTALRVQQGEISYFSPESKKAQDQFEADLNKNQNLQDLALGGVPLEILGFIATIERFSDMTDREKLEELRSWTTPSMIRWYLGVLKGKRHKSELSPVQILDRLSKQVIKNIQSVKVNLLENFFEEKIWDQISQSGRNEGLVITAAAIAKIDDPGEKSFMEGVYNKVFDIVTSPRRAGFKEKIRVKEEIREFPAPEQQTFDWDFNHYGTRLLRGETGVGKTATAFYVMEGTKATNVLVLVPASGRETFSKEEKVVFENPGQVFIIKGSADIDRAIRSGKKYIVVGQELLARAEKDVELGRKLDQMILTLKTSGAILDEIHNLSNPNIYTTKIARHLIALIRENYNQMFDEDDAPVIGLTATHFKRGFQDMNVPMAILYPYQYAATPAEATEIKKTFSDSCLNRPDLAYIALIAEKRMFNWAVARGVQPFEYRNILIQPSSFEQLLYEFIGTQIPTNTFTKISLLENVTLNPALIKIAVRNLANGKIPEIDFDLATEMLKKAVRGWKELRGIESPQDDTDFLDVDRLVELGFGDLVLSCFFSHILENGVDILVEAITDDAQDQELMDLGKFWRKRDLSTKYQALKDSIREDLTWKVGEDGVMFRNRVIIVSPGEVQGRTADVKQKYTANGEKIYTDWELKSINDATLAKNIACWTEDLIDKDGMIIIDGSDPIGRRRNSKIDRWVNVAEAAILFVNLPAVYQSRDFTSNRVIDLLGRRIAGVSQYFLHPTWFFEELKQMAGRSQRQGQVLEVDTEVLEALGMVDEGKGEFVQFTDYLTRISLFGLRLAPELVEFIDSRNAARRRIRYQNPEARFLYDVFNTVRGAGEDAIERFLGERVAGEERTYSQKVAERYFDEGRDEYKTSGYNAEFVASVIQHLGLTEGQILSLGAGTLLLQRKLKRGVDNVDMNPYMMEAGWTLAKEFGGRMITSRISQLDGSVIPEGSYDCVDYSFALHWSNLGNKLDNSERLSLLRIVHNKLKERGRLILTLPDSVFDDQRFENFIKGLEATKAFTVDRSLSGKTFGISKLGSVKRLGWSIVAQKTGAFDLTDVSLSDFEFLKEGGEWISLGPKEKERLPVVKTGDYPSAVFKVKFAGYEIINPDNDVTTVTFGEPQTQQKDETVQTSDSEETTETDGHQPLVTRATLEYLRGETREDFEAFKRDLIRPLRKLFGMSWEEAEAFSLEVLQQLETKNRFPKNKIMVYTTILKTARNQFKGNGARG